MATIALRHVASRALGGSPARSQSPARSAKKFGINDLVKKSAFAKPQASKNLLEMVAPYPTQGVGFIARKADWPADKYVKIASANIADIEAGEAYGEFFENGQKVSDKPTLIEDCLETDWTYEIGESEVTLDNGVSYSAKDMLAFWKAEMAD